MEIYSETSTYVRGFRKHSEADDPLLLDSVFDPPMGSIEAAFEIATINMLSGL